MEKYGIDAFEAGADALETLQGLYEKVYADDGVINRDDLPDVLIALPSLTTSVLGFINKAGQIGKQWDDLSNTELADLDQITRSKIKDENYADAIKHLIGLSVAIDRITEDRKAAAADVATAQANEEIRTQ